jgi:hypothetical protein
MGIDGRKSSRSNQGIAISVWDMDMGLWIPESLRKAKINDVGGILVRIGSNQDIFRLQVSVNNVTCVYLLKPGNLCELSQYIGTN